MQEAGTRRQFLFKVTRLGGVGLTGGALWGWLVNESKAKPFALNPPGALMGQDFLAACIKCGMCVDACPYDTLALSPMGAPGPLGVPSFVPRKTPCYMCPDVPCAKVCPSGALDKETKIEQARMGVAVLVDQSTCIAFQGLRCEVCYRVCPLMGKAINLRYRHQERTGKHAFFEPVVNGDLCTGCGLCEYACILEEAAIKVLPHRLAKGRIGENYRLGWKEKSVISEDFTPQDAQPSMRQRQLQEETLDNALERLNAPGKLHD